MNSKRRRSIQWFKKIASDVSGGESRTTRNCRKEKKGRMEKRVRREIWRESNSGLSCGPVVGRVVDREKVREEQGVSGNDVGSRGNLSREGRD